MQDFYKFLNILNKFLKENFEKGQPKYFSACNDYKIIVGKHLEKITE